MRWVRNFIEDFNFPAGIAFASRMIWSGDHRIVEYARVRGGCGGGRECRRRREPGLRHPQLRGEDTRSRRDRTAPDVALPFRAWKHERDRETSESFRAESEMTHPLFGRTLGYAGTCKIESTG